MEKQPEALLNRNFRRDLEPILEMLEEKEKMLSEKEWKKLVSYTRDRVVAAPDQFLSEVRMPSVLVTRIVESIFEEELRIQLNNVN